VPHACARQWMRSSIRLKNILLNMKARIAHVPESPPSPPSNPAAPGSGHAPEAVHINSAAGAGLAAPAPPPTGNAQPGSPHANRQAIAPLPCEPCAVSTDIIKVLRERSKFQMSHIAFLNAQIAQLNAEPPLPVAPAERRAHPAQPVSGIPSENAALRGWETLLSRALGGKVGQWGAAETKSLLDEFGPRGLKNSYAAVNAFGKLYHHIACPKVINATGTFKPSITLLHFADIKAYNELRPADSTELVFCNECRLRWFQKLFG
jgi:hypothetical protein